jgi:hypothetical protein
MSQAEADMQVLNLLLIIVDVLIYFAFVAIAAIWNKVAKREVLSRRVAGSVGVVLFTCVAMVFARVYVVNEKVLNSLPPFEGGAYVGSIVAIPLFPAILVLGFAGFRGWLARRKKRKAAERGA